MKSAIHKCVVSFTPVTNPTQYTKLGKQMIRSKIRLLLELSNLYMFAFVFAVEGNLAAVSPA